MTFPVLINSHVARSLTLLSLLSASGQVNALEFTFNGFGSFVVGRAISTETLPDGSESTYQVVPTHATKDNGTTNTDAQYDSGWSWQPDSNVGFQLSALFNEDFLATVQITGYGADNLNPEVEWAYLSYDLTDRLNIKAGRMRLPFYRYSDYLDVGYAYHWIRPPVDVYGEGASVYEGASLNYTMQLGEFNVGTKLWYGNIENDNALNWRARVDDVGGIVLSIERDWLSIRTSYHSGDAYADTVGILTLPAKSTDRENPSDASFISLGFMADFEQYFFGAEFVQVKLDPYLERVSPNPNPNPMNPASNYLVSRTGDRDAFMITGGYRFGDFTVHATYSERESTLTVPAHPILSNEVKRERQTVATGIRWDFYENMALKAELTMARDKSDSVAKSVLGDQLESQVFAIGLDYVF